MSDVTVSDSGFSVAITETAQGSVTVDSAGDGAVSATVSEDFSVSVVERPTGRIVVDGDIPTDFVKTINASSPIAVSIATDGTASISHETPGTAVAQNIYPTSLTIDSTGHVRSVSGESSAASMRSNLGLTTAATTSKSDFLTTDNTSSFGRTFADHANSSAARSALELGSAATSSTSDFAAASHNQDASTINSGTLSLSRLPSIPFTQLTTGSLGFDLVPDTDSSRSIGSSTKYLSELYADLIYGNSIGAVFVQGKNSTGSTIAKGSAVYCSGNDGTLIQVAKADANDLTAMPCIGIVAADIANTATGNIAIAGVLTDLDTSSFTAGSSLYVSTTAGALTSTPSTESQCIGQVILSRGSGGQILINLAGKSHENPSPAQVLDGGSQGSTMISMTSLFNDSSIFDGGKA